MLDIASNAINTATGGAIGGIMDLAFGGIKNKRALKQDRKIGEQQMAREKEMTQYGYDLGMKKIGDTPKAMREAGLNVGLMYGTGGQSGQSVQTASEGVHAPTDQSNSIGMGMQLGQQKELLNAQIENVKQDTVKKGVEADKLAGVDTTNVQADTTKKEAEAVQLAAQTGLTIEQARKVVLEQTKTQAETTNTEANTRKQNVERQNIQADTTKKGAETTNIKADTNVKEAQEKNIKQATQKIIAEIHNGQIALDQKDIELYQGEWRIRNEAVRLKIETELRKMGLDVQNKGVMNDALRTIILGGSVLNGMGGARPVIGF